MRRDEEPFVWTDRMSVTVKWISFVPSACALVAATLVLVFAAALYRNPHTRHAVKRQSFVLMLAVQVASLFFSVAYIVETFMTSPTASCAPMLVIGMLSNNFFTFVIGLIAVNLQLVIVHSINTSGFTRWYLVGALVAAVATVLPSAVKGVWGWDPLSNACWIQLTGPRSRAAWVVGTEYFPNLLAAFVALVSTAAVLWHLFVMKRRVEHAMSETSDGSSSRTSKLLRRVVLRIIWYPLLLIVGNVVALSADMSVNNDDGIETEADFRLWCVYAFLFGARPLFYALVVLFLDPAFSAAVREHILKAAAHSEGPTPATGMSSIGFRRRGSSTIDVELGRVDPWEVDAPGSERTSLGADDRRASKATLSTPPSISAPNSKPAVSKPTPSTPIDVEEAAGRSDINLGDDVRRRISVLAPHTRRPNMDLSML